MTNLLDQLKANKDKLTDQTEDSGGFEYVPPAAGPCLMRFVSYIEIGNFAQSFNGQPKKPAPECILEFELLGKKHAKEIEIEAEDGTKTKKTVYPIIRIGQGPSGKGGMSMPGGAKSNFYKLLKAMDAGRGNTHMAFMLGEAFLGTVVHSDNGKEGKEKVVYANLRDETGWKIGAPVRVNDEGETEALKAPPATVDLRMLLWDAPTIEQWNSIYIPGTYTKKVNDKDVEISRNWIQKAAQSALNYEGSALQNVIAEFEGDLPKVDVDPTPDMDDDSDVYDGGKSSEGIEGTQEAEKAPEGSEDGSDDPLADLGLEV